MADLMKVSDEVLERWRKQGWTKTERDVGAELLAYRRLIMPPDGPTLHDRLDAVLDELRGEQPWCRRIADDLALIVEDVAAVTP